MKCLARLAYPHAPGTSRLTGQHYSTSCHRQVLRGRQLPDMSPSCAALEIRTSGLALERSKLRRPGVLHLPELALDYVLGIGCGTTAVPVPMTVAAGGLTAIGCF